MRNFEVGYNTLDVSMMEVIVYFNGSSNNKYLAQGKNVLRVQKALNLN